MWAAAFCENYSRMSIQQSTLWGVRNFDNVAVTRADYKDCPVRDTKASIMRTIGASVCQQIQFVKVSCQEATLKLP